MESAQSRVSHLKDADFLLELEPPFKSLLQSMYLGEPQLGHDGKLHQLDGVTKISAFQGMWLYHFCRHHKVATTLEIGMAYGFSTLFLLAAISRLHGSHIAIDPFQYTTWHGIGLTKVGTALANGGHNIKFAFVEDRSDHAAPNLIDQGNSVDLVFIDGCHKFDDVLVDFYLYSNLCKIGGFVVFDDMWMESIQKAVSFVKTNREDFIPIDTKFGNVAAFQRKAVDQRNWNHFCAF
jgi:predicted O-methyltransferase YrrM